MVMFMMMMMLMKVLVMLKALRKGDDDKDNAFDDNDIYTSNHYNNK